MKTIIITGAGSGVGRETVKLLKDEKLVLIDKDEKSLIAVGKKFACDYYVCDISKIEDIEKTFTEIKTKYKKIDVLINCAGLWTKGELSQQEDEHFKEINTYERIKQIIDTNTFGTIAIIKAVFPIMKKQGYGQIININSQSGIVTEEFCPVYNASKHGSRAFSQAVLSDLARHNIKMTDVCPGLIKTDFYVHANDELPKEIMDTGLEAKDVADVIKYLIELPKQITVPSIEIKNMKNF